VDEVDRGQLFGVAAIQVLLTGLPLLPEYVSLAQISHPVASTKIPNET